MMNRLQDTRQKWKRVLYSKWILFALVVCIGLLVHATWNIYQKERESAIGAVQSARELAQIESRQQKLQESVDRLQTPEGVEEQIRLKYGVAKPGENVIVIQDSTTGVSTSTQGGTGWWNKFLGWFK